MSQKASFPELFSIISFWNSSYVVYPPAGYFVLVNLREMSRLVENKLPGVHRQENCSDNRIRLQNHILCCEGYRMVNQLINQNGLCDYYQFNQRPGVNRRSTRIPVQSILILWIALKAKVKNPVLSILAVGWIMLSYDECQTDLLGRILILYFNRKE